MELLGKATWKAKPRWVAASEVGSERFSIAWVDGNAARVAGASTGRARDQGKTAKEAASERGQRMSFNGATGASDPAAAGPRGSGRAAGAAEILSSRSNRSRASALGIIGTTPKARTRTGSAARKPLYHQSVANGTVRSCFGQIRISCGFLHLASLASRTNDANETALSFQPEPIQRYSNDNDQNRADNEYRFGFAK
jgi:hypothetical protein